MSDIDGNFQLLVELKITRSKAVQGFVVLTAITNCMPASQRYTISTVIHCDYRAHGNGISHYCGGNLSLLTTRNLL